MGRLGVKGIASTILIICIALLIVGCSAEEEEITLEDFKKLKEEVTLDCGLTVLELESLMTRFAYNVYNPQKEDDIKKGIELIKGITTELEFNELLDIAGEYDPDIKNTVTNIEVKHSTKENNSDGMERVFIEVTYELEGYKQNTALEFVFNHNNKIARHYIWYGSVGRY